MSNQKVTIDEAHEPWGEHVDVITPLRDVRGAEKLRIGPTGEIISNEIGVKGDFWFNASDD